MNLNQNKTLLIFLSALFITLVIIFVIFPLLNRLTTDNFFNGSGYGLNSKFGRTNTLIPLNLVSKSTDFKLFSLLSQIKFSFIKPSSNYKITGTNEGIISVPNKKSKNIILFPGQSDFILRQDGKEVWPNNFENINNSKSAVIYDNNEGHFNTINTLLHNLDYKDGYNLNTIVYDFRNINFNTIINKFINLLNDNTVIIAYDFGTVIANLCINKLTKEQKSKIDKFILICPTIGGVPMTIRDYFSGNGIIDTKIIENYDSVLLSMPNSNFYEYPIAIYNSLSYTASPKNIIELLKSGEKQIDKYIKLLNIQQDSLKNPEVDCIIIGSEQFNTPISYNFKNNLKQSPERYLAKNNNQFPNDDIHNNGTFEGIQDKGDRVVPINTIKKLKNLWGNNCQIELIKDKDHFTILKSYELALIILANL